MRKMDNGATNIATLGPEQIKNFHQTLLTNVFAQKLEQNKRQIETLNDYKKRHEKVIEGLQVYPLSVSENCMVPIGKRALMKGKLTHTNEILVCLGDGYFAKYSAPQAMLLCNRRIAWADKMLKDLEAERNLYEMRQILPLQHDLFGDGDRKDLWEYWDEDQLDEWRVLHRQREKEYRQKLAKLREQEKTDICTDEDLLKRLDDLEEEEELKEIYRLEAKLEKPLRNDLEKGEVYDESEEDDTSDSDEITSKKMEEKLQKLQNILIDKYIKDMSKKYVSCEVTRDATLDKNEQTSPAAHSSQDRLKRNYSSVFDVWRVFTILHKQHEIKCRQKLAKLREQEKTDIRAAEDLLKRLDEELEEGQKLRDKIYRLEAELQELLTNDLEKGEIYDESEEDDTSDSDEITSEKIEEELQKLKNIQIDKYIKNTSKKYVSCEVTQDEILDKNEQISPAAHSSQDRLKENYSSEHLGNVSEDTSLKKRRVSFVEPCAIENDTKEEISQKSCSVLKQNYTHDEDSKEVDDIIQIEFLHSSCTPNIPESNTTEIQSPTDIYKMFTPKSILKRSPNDVNQIALPLDEDSTTETEDEDDYVKPSAYISVIKEVQENEVSTKNTLEKKDEKKIVSKFKLERAARKK